MANGKAARNKASTEARTAITSEQRIRRAFNRGAGEVADWRLANPALLSRAIQAVTSRNCAITFGYTRDSGAYTVGILGDGDPYTGYIRPTEDLDAQLEALALDFEK